MAILLQALISERETMETVVGVFQSRDDAMRAARQLRSEGSQDINLLMPGATDGQIHAVPTTSTEQPGMGKAIGGVVGGALGAAGGLELGALAAAGFMTGVGPVVAIGIAAAAILGATGSVIGAAGGSALEEKALSGLPEDGSFSTRTPCEKGAVCCLSKPTGTIRPIRCAISSRGLEQRALMRLVKLGGLGCGAPNGSIITPPGETWTGTSPPIARDSRRQCAARNPNLYASKFLDSRPPQTARHSAGDTNADGSMLPLSFRSLTSGSMRRRKNRFQRAILPAIRVRCREVCLYVPAEERIVTPCADRMADPRGARGLKKLISTQQWEFSGPPCCGEIRRIYLRGNLFYGRGGDQHQPAGYTPLEVDGFTQVLRSRIEELSRL